MFGHRFVDVRRIGRVVMFAVCVLATAGSLRTLLEAQAAAPGADSGQAGPDGPSRTPADASLTLEAAMARALDANPTIAAARLRHAIDLASLAVARERANPDLSVEIEKETPRQSVAFGVPIELGGKRARRTAVGNATLRAGDAEVAATIAQVRNDVRRAYFAVLVADSRAALMRDARDTAVRVRDTAQRRFDAGDAPRLDVLQGEMSLATAENEATAAQGAARAARAELNALLGQPLDFPVTPTTPIGSGGALTVEAALALARSSSTALLALDRQIDTARASLALARAQRVPDIVPTATLTHGAAPEFDYGWRAGVSLTVPLFTTHQAGVAVEQATIDQLVAQREAVLQQITGDVTSAAITVETERALYERYRDDILPQTQQVEQLAQDSYQLGQTGLVALLQALQATRDVRLRALDAASQFQSALADLERAIGAPLP
jgi:cobalt-zinc-cadmium efflux system outer membrane protein